MPRPRALALLLLVWAGSFPPWAGRCAQADPPSTAAPPISGVTREAGDEPAPALPPVARRIVESQRDFALRLYPRLRTPGANLLFSPFSIHTALALLREGARGATASELDRVLGALPADATSGWAALVARVSEAPRLAARTGALEPAYSLAVANALYAQRDAGIPEAFRERLREVYLAEISDVDFLDRPEAAREEINAWVEARTRRRIRDLLAPGTVDASTLLVLVNALHLVAAWQQPFDAAAPRRAGFAAESGPPVAAQMMSLSGSLRLLEEPDARVVALPYRGGALELVLALPRAPRGLVALEDSLTAARLEAWGRAGERTAVWLELPRFGFESALDLRSALRALGLERVFDAAAADLGGLAPAAPRALWLGDVVHRAAIAVDERGTEAAAATATSVSRGAGGADLELIFDRPFLFLIRHVPTGALLFVGRLAAPPPSGEPEQR